MPPPKPAEKESLPDADGVYTSGGKVSAPQLIYSVEPDPEAAQAAHIEGKVLVHLTVDRTGKPTKVSAITTLGYGLDEEAIKAVSQYKFRAATLTNIPIATYMNVEVQFQDLNSPKP